MKKKENSITYDMYTQLVWLTEWFEGNASRREHEADILNNRFPSLATANRYDAVNFRKMADSIRKITSRAEAEDSSEAVEVVRG